MDVDERGSTVKYMLECGLSIEKSFDLKSLAERIISIVGPGETCVVDKSESGISAHLRMMGLPVSTSLPHSPIDGVFDSIVLFYGLEELDGVDLQGLLKDLCAHTRRCLLLKIDLRRTGIGKDRSFYERYCFEAGYRKHPCYYFFNIYEELNNEKDVIFIPLEKIPKQAFDEYSIQQLDQDRVLHMDMLREVGRRGDAHCIRYQKAAEWIRPNDVVLDIACGLGYGSHILFQNSLANKVLGIDLCSDSIRYAQKNYSSDGVEFRQGNAEDLACLADNSIDFISTFETIEHLPRPEEYLKELRRVLKPSGRMFICAPNNWADETGKDPNPHHFHVYTWDRLKKEVGNEFILEKGYIQVAGGAMKCHHSPRQWGEVPLEGELSKEAEWILLLAMKDPQEGLGITFKETSWNIPDHPDFNVASFARDYKNPWLVKGMVTRGFRITSSSALRKIQHLTLTSYSPSSPDYGAALCGACYQVDPIFDNVKLDDLLEKIDDFVRVSSPNPQVLRWQTSLLFAAGELFRKKGNLDKAYEKYSLCAAMDVSQFSPLLGMKVIESYYQMAQIDYCAGDIEKAKQNLQRSIDFTQCLLSKNNWINIIGDTRSPLDFGFPELAELCDKASRAVYTLNCMSSSERRKQMAFRSIGKGYFERILADKDDKIRVLLASQKELVSEVSRIEKLSQEIAKELIELHNCLKKRLTLKGFLAERFPKFFALLRFIKWRLGNAIAR